MTYMKIVIDFYMNSIQDASGGGGPQDINLVIDFDYECHATCLGD
jgi:hypothetical protein